MLLLSLLNKTEKNKAKQNRSSWLKKIYVEREKFTRDDQISYTFREKFQVFVLKQKNPVITIEVIPVIAQS